MQQETGEIYRTLVEHANDAIVLVQHGKLVYQNPAHEKLLGYTTGETAKRNFLDFVIPEDRERVQEYYQKRLSGEAVPEQYELALLSQDGRGVTVEVKPRVITYQGEPATMVVIRDVTERKRMVEAIRAAKEYAENLINSSLDIIVSVDTNRRIIEFNRAAEQTFGYRKAEVLGQPVDMLYANPAENVRMRECLLQSGTYTGEARNKRKDGSIFVAYLSTSVMRDSNGKVIGVMGISRDITERKLLESQLAQAQKIESIGQLAAGIAHEINTPTQYVSDNTRFLKEAFADLGQLLEQYDALFQAANAGAVTEPLLHEVTATMEAVDMAYLCAEIPTAIQQSLDGLARVATIVRAVKEFAHPGSEGKTAIDLNKAIESTLTVAHSEWKYVAELVTDFDPALPIVPCLPGEFNQVILNLLVNAAHAIADVVGKEPTAKGTITVRTRQDGGWVEVRVADTGTGIPAAVRAKVFDPFFTTKEVGKGTGQGLALAHAVVVEKHRGTLTFETAAGEGTTFILRLPLDAPLPSAV